MVFDFLDSSAIITEAVLATVAGTISGVFLYLRHVAKRDRELCRRLDQQDRNIAELKNDIKLMHKWSIIFAQLIDQQTQKAHPDEISKLKDITKAMLNGNKQ